MARFSDKVAVVTGASSGFGEAISTRFAAEGASVVLADLDEAGGKRVQVDIERAGGSATFVRTDVSLSDDVREMIEAAVNTYGGLDILVNNAGVSHRTGPITELSEREYDRVFAVNTKSVYLAAFHGVPALRARGGGVIINTASIGAVAPRPGVVVYNATKGAVITLTRGLAVELARDRIRVNAVNPVAADTAFMRGAVGVHPLPDAVKDQLIRGIPLGRLTEPRDVAASVLFLASDEAEFLTGVCLDIDGGRSIS